MPITTTTTTLRVDVWSTGDLALYADDNLVRLSAPDADGVANIVARVEELMLAMIDDADDADD